MSINKQVVLMVVLLVVAVGLFLYSQGGTTTSALPSRTVGPTVTFDGKQFVPATLTIKQGDTVTFVNDSATSTWPASAMHPTHKVYPTTGGCLGSTFDACRALGQGELWLFKFDISGSWKYHDHLNPTIYGTIVVQ